MEQNELLTQIAQMMEDQMERLETKILESEARIKIMIENDVTRRLDALTDGYKLNHEKQYELEHQSEKMQAQIADLQMRIAALENKIA